ncbi:MAG TPA: hypothetical protein VGD10_12045 [Allosphingosinicella sp.]|uniref:hypothetical protein n=1 Tax=Allosphingosinicella sp. TaxID=2823234 RepID=UPI002EDA8DAD
MSAWLAKSGRSGKASPTPTPPPSVEAEPCEPYLSVESRADWSIQETLAVLAARQEYGQRRERDKIFEDGIFADPGWDLLLDLFVMASEGRAVSIPHACAAAYAHPGTVRNLIAHMEKSGLIRRIAHPAAPDCAYLELSDSAYQKMLQYFSVARKAYFEPHG